MANEMILQSARPIERRDAGCDGMVFEKGMIQ